MTNITTEDDTTEGSDGGDKPPHAPLSNGLTSTTTELTSNRMSIPLPPPDAYAYEKQPGHTSADLAASVKAAPPIITTAPSQGSIPLLSSVPPTPLGTQNKQHDKEPSFSSNGSTSTASSPTQSESGWGSAPSTRPPSRAPSFSASIAEKVAAATKLTSKSPAMAHNSESTLRAKSPSIHSRNEDGGHKFNLKDLLGNTPKLSRKSSQRSNSSRKSDGAESDGGGSRRARSTAGDSVASLSQKYGVCQKLAIGKGATSVVRLAHKWDSGPGSEEKLYAVKEFRKRRKNETEKEYIKKLTAEFCISSTLHHVNIVETVDLVQDEQAKWCEVMEFCPGGDLYAAIKKGGMSPSEVECCFKQILCGVHYLHSQGVAHRDIKPENLFFDLKGHLKIGDYGASTVYRLPWEATVHMSTGLCGSEPYISPEQFLGKPYDARLVDIWACGIVYYCLHFQELPWRAAQMTDSLYASYATACQAHPLPAATTTTVSNQTSSKSAQPTYPPTISNLPRLCRPLLRSMLEPNPKKRADIEAIIKDRWIKEIEVCWEAANAGGKPCHVHVNLANHGSG